MKPTSTPTAERVAPVPPPEKSPSQDNKKKKKIVIGGIAGLIVLVIAAVCLYLFWFQNPQKVVTDAIIHASQAEELALKGELNVKVQGNDIKIDFDGEGNQSVGKASVTIDAKVQNMKLKATADVVAADNGDYYLKAGNVQQAADALADQFISSLAAANVSSEQKEQMKAQFKAQIDPIVAKVDNRWIRVSAEDTKDTTEELSKLQTCVSEVRTLLREDDSASRELSDAYKKHQFISIDEKLDSKDGALGYKVSVNKETAKKFEEATKESKVVKKLESCTDTTANDETSVDDATQAEEEMTIWVSRWSHTLEKISLSAKQDEVKTDAEVEFDFDKSPKVDTPQGATPLKEVVREIEALLSSEASAEL